MSGSIPAAVCSTLRGRVIAIPQGGSCAQLRPLRRGVMPTGEALSVSAVRRDECFVPVG